MMLTTGAYRPLAPQAFAETSPQFFSSFFMPRTGLQMATTFVTYGVMYQVQSNVFACVDKIANLVARLDRSVYDINDPDSEDVDHSGPYAKLIADPCDTVDPFAFYHWWVTTYEIYGEVYGIKNRNETAFGGSRTDVRSIIPMHPAMTEIHRNPEGDLMYRFMGMPNELIPETEVVVQRRYNPFNTMRGLSRLEPLRLTLMNEDGARRAQISWWDNMCRPSMVLSTPKKLGTAGRERLQQAVDATMQSADNAGGTLVLEDDVTATRMQLGAEELQYIQSRMFNREEVCSVYDIAPQAVQFMTMGDVGITSYQGIVKDIYKFSIDTRLKATESAFDWQIGSEIPMGHGERKFRFNVAQQLRGDVETLAPAAVQLVQSGIAMPSEMRKWFDLPDAGDVAKHLYANRAMQLLGEQQITFAEQGMLNPPANAGELPNPNATNTQSPKATGDLPKKVPALTDKAKHYMNCIESGMGRGERWDRVALKLLSRNEDDRQDVQLACLHILER